MAQNNRLIIIVSIIIVLIIAGIFISNNTGLFTLTKETNKTITIGLPVSLTGKLASYGEVAINSANLAMTEINAQNGKYKLNLVYDDTQTDKKIAVDVVNKMLAVDNIHLFVGAGSSGEVLSIAPLTESSKSILFVTMASADDISNAGDLVFRNRETARLHSDKMAEYLINSNVKEIVVFTANSPNGLSYSREFVSMFKSLGGNVESYFEYQDTTQDFITEIAKANLSDKDTIYFSPSAGPDAGLFVKQLVESGFNGKIFGTYTLDNPEFLQLSGNITNKLIITAPTLDNSDKKTQEFIKNYKQVYQKEVGPFGANTYDAIYLLYNAAILCSGDKNTECIRDYLYALENYSGAEGIFSFDENGDVIKEIGFETLKDGKFVPY